MIRLVCIDVDGTLVGSRGDVAPNVWEAAARARRAGVRLAICSGRPAFGVSRAYAARLDPDGWHAFQNGASVVHLGTGASRSSAIDPEAVARLVADARRAERVLELYGDDDYTVERDAPEARAHAELLGVPFRVRPHEALGGPVVRAQWLAPLEADIEPIHEAAAGLAVVASTSPVMPATRFVMATRPGVGKGSAVRALAAASGVDLASTMFVGDGGNDVEALRVVGYPVAMANAEPAAAAAARRHAGHVDAGGLAEALGWAVDGW